MEGFACRYSLTDEGKRQILSFHISGDIPDLQSLHLRVMDHSLGTLIPSKLAFIHHDDLRALMRSHPLPRRPVLARHPDRSGGLSPVDRGARAARGPWPDRASPVRIAGAAAGGRTVEDHAFNLPVTQAELGDALGISPVHVNRVLQELRGENLISWHGDALKVLDWERLQKAGEFDPTYLHLVKKEVL